MSAVAPKLQLDEKMSTSLAEDYIRRHSGEFGKFNEYCTNIEHDTTRDSFGNKIYICNHSIDFDLPHSLGVDFNLLLSQSLIDNANLFAQLDYLIRKTPQHDTINYDMKILGELTARPCKSNYVRMGVKSPLFELCKSINQKGDKLNDVHCLIYATPETAAVCTLFAELCIKAGLPKHRFMLHITSDQSLPTLEIIGSKPSCIAVLTQESDIDSSLTSIASATTNGMYPWKLSRVIVQESIYEKLKKKLKFISTMTKDNGQSVELKPLQKCSTDVIKYGGKVLLFDCVQDIVDKSDSLVLVEAYRTTKELLSLLDRYRPLYLSLWCNNLSVSNEIAFCSNVNNIWVNDYGLFEDIDVSPLHNKLTEPVEILDSHRMPYEKLCQLWSKWKMLKDSERRRAFIKYIEMSKDKECIWKEFMTRVLHNWSSSSSISRRGNILIQHIAQSHLMYSISRDLPIMKSILDGNGAIFLGFEKEPTEKFAELGIPIILIDDMKFNYDVAVSLGMSVVINDDRNFYSKKTIWSKFGETFAN